MIAFATPTPLESFIRRVHAITNLDRDTFARHPDGVEMLDIAIAVVDSAAAGLRGNEVDVLIDRVAGSLDRSGTVPLCKPIEGDTPETRVARAAWTAAAGIGLIALLAGEDLTAVAKNLRWVG